MVSTSHSKDPSEAKRWLIIGAHQAGASEKSVARISGLSKTAVRHIILNYRRTGNPCLPQQEPKKVKEKLLVEYDENGQLILSEDEEDKVSHTPKSCNKGLYNNHNTSNKAIPHQSINKRRSPKLNSKVTSKNLIEYVMEQVKRVEREQTPFPTYTSSTSSALPNKTHQAPQHYQGTWCPTPPRDPSISGDSSMPNHAIDCNEAERINKSNERQQQQQHQHHHIMYPTSPSLFPLSPPSISGNKPSSPMEQDYDDDADLDDDDDDADNDDDGDDDDDDDDDNNNGDNQVDDNNGYKDEENNNGNEKKRYTERKRRRRLRRSSSKSIPPYYSPGKCDQTIRGYEVWTHKDDMLLLQHVLTRLQLGNWRELETKFEGRHSARLCVARWRFLRDNLLRGIAKAECASI